MDEMQWVCIPRLWDPLARPAQVVVTAGPLVGRFRGRYLFFGASACFGTCWPGVHSVCPDGRSILRSVPAGPALPVGCGDPLSAVAEDVSPAAQGGMILEAPLRGPMHSPTAWVFQTRDVPPSGTYHMNLDWRPGI